MQIQSTNNISNPGFGTRVLMNPGTKEIVESSKAKREIYNQIAQLKKNGVNDFLILCGDRNKDNKVSINSEVVEFNDDKCFINSMAQSDFIEKKLPDGEKEYINIINLYKLSKEKMVPIRMLTKNLFDTLLHKYQEI